MSGTERFKDIEGEKRLYEMKDVGPGSYSQEVEKKNLKTRNSPFISGSKRDAYQLKNSNEMNYSQDLSWEKKSFNVKYNKLIANMVK